MYVCPVCETPQADAEHLADHLAFTAMLRGGDHEAWLEERVPDWADRGPAELGSAVAEHASEREAPDQHEHDHADHARERVADRRERGRRHLDSGAQQGGGSSEAVADVLREARELTERMYGADGEDEASDDEMGGDGAASRDDEAAGGDGN